ncbi:MAG: OmpA family protein [Crocinitomicaceae bacterium]|nr:OmpA family protein [Flavobacteriales bacterium]NQZ37269.1 OmpA family protein [Crocinitomicaceae bacterium]
MAKILFIIVLLLVTPDAFSQKAGKNTSSLNSCMGGINIFEDGDFQLQFTGKKSNDNTVDAYPSLSRINSENYIWISYIAPIDGDLTFTASKKSGFVQMVIFEEEQKDICGEISQGIAEIKRLHIGKESSIVGLDYHVDGGIMYSLPMKEGRKYQLLFATESESKDKLYLQWRFVSGGKSEPESQIIDRRTDDFAPTFKIIVRDKETNEPIIASLSIEGNKSIAGMYIGSDFMFNIDRKSKLTIKCDAEGYFLNDLEEDASPFEDQEITLDLERVSAGRSMKIEEIEFVPGTSKITLASEPKLRRLKDFLALNSSLDVEIQGHVFAIGDNSFAAQKVSEARAKRVMKYLIDNGIDKHRLTAVGHGNTRPIYAEPKFFYEEQANRRVEVVVK